MERVRDIRIIKKELRAKYRSYREALDPTEKQRYDNAIFTRMVNASFFKNTQTLLCFVSTGIEVDTRAMIEHAFQEKKRVAVPKCLDREGNMGFFLINSLEELCPCMFGLLEPDPARSEPLTDFRDSLCILPAFAFDFEGYRIGFGKGYYDRFLQKYSGVKAGVCYNACLADRLPRGRFDVAADYIVTPKYTLTVKKSDVSAITSKKKQKKTSGS